MISLLFIFFIIIFAFIGMGVNSIAVKITHDEKLNFSHGCNSCGSALRWRDRFPFISWIHMRGRCRSCRSRISWHYPFIELWSVIVGISLYKIFYLPFSFQYRCEMFIAYYFFCTLLLAATRSDLEAMVIPRLFSLYSVPLGLLCAWSGVLFISPLESVLGVVLGYGVLWFVGFCFFKLRNKKGLGEGDMELLALVGSFLGLQGVVYTVLYGSISGIIFSLLYLYVTKKSKETPIPFGPFLAFGAWVYLLQAI